MKPACPQAILLDFFGTVVEDIRIPVMSICRSITEVAPEGVNDRVVVAHWVRLFSELCTQSYGSDFQRQKEIETRSLQTTLEHFHIPLDAHILSQSISDYRAHPTLFPESRKVLNQCPIPICLVSNVDNSEIESALNHLNMKFDFVVTSESCRSYKPRSDTFEKALWLLGLTADKVLHVGDSWESDVRGAQILGIPVLWIDRRNRAVSVDGRQPDHIASDLTGLLEVLKK